MANFFKKIDIFQSIGKYFNRANIQTQDHMRTDLEVKTLPSSWAHTVMPSSWHWYNSQVYPGQQFRVKRYQDYMMMDDDGDISNALNIYADDSTQTDFETGNVFHIDADNPEVKDCINDLFYETLHIDKQLWGLARDLCKYGDSPFEIVLNQDKTSIVKLVPIPIEGFMRVEKNRTIDRFLFNPRMLNLNNINSAMERQDIVDYDPYEVAHFTLTTNEMRYYPYGRSILESSRKVWRQLKIMEDALVINRLTRAPERKVFFVEVGNLSSGEAEQFLERIKAKYSKSKYMNQITGEIDEKASPLNQSEDFFIPVRNNQGSRIESLPGACLSLDTQIPLLDGRVLPLQTIIDEFNQGKNNYVYSCDPATGKITSGVIEWAGVTRKDTELLELTLDNGKTIKCTPDHKFPIIGKGFVEAKDLVIGESMIPFYTGDVITITLSAVTTITNADTGTITVGNEYHTFALESGVFTKNSNLDQVDDVKMFRDKMISALGIPPQYMARSNEQGKYDSKAGLSQQDIRFGRTIMRIQKAIVSTMYKVAYIQLYLKGFGINDIKGLKLGMTPPNALEEAMGLMRLQQRLDVAQTAKSTNLFSDEWILRTVMHFSDEEYVNVKDQKASEGDTGKGGAPSHGGGIGGGIKPPMPEEPESDFESFNPETPDEVPEPPTQGRVEVAGKEYGNVNMVNETKTKKNNKYIYGKTNRFTHLLNEGELTGLIDTAKADEERQQILSESRHTAKTYDFRENITNEEGDTDENEETHME
jgi:hypothetical protein